MNYSQLIQFKRLEERAFIFLNGRQLILGFFGMFGGMVTAYNIGVSGLPVWILSAVLGVLGVVAGGVYRGLYGYQYLLMLFRTWTRLGETTNPQALYRQERDVDYGFSLGAPGGGALVQYQPPARRQKTRRKEDGEASVYRLTPVDLAQYPPQMVGALINRWGGFWAGLRPPLRLIVHSTPFEAGNVIDDVHAQSLVAREEWRVRALSGYGRFLENLNRKAAMYQARHECLIWANSEPEAGATMGVPRLLAMSRPLWNSRLPVKGERR